MTRRPAGRTWTDPKWKGKIGLSNPTKEGATPSALVMIDKYGQQKALDPISKMYNNAKLTYGTPGAEESALARGDTQGTTPRWVRPW